MLPEIDIAGAFRRSSSCRDSCGLIVLCYGGRIVPPCNPEYGDGRFLAATEKSIRTLKKTIAAPFLLVALY
jgi:hypothetical protein